MIEAQKIGALFTYKAGRTNRLMVLGWWLTDTQESYEVGMQSLRWHALMKSGVEFSN